MMNDNARGFGTEEDIHGCLVSRACFALASSMAIAAASLMGGGMIMI
jgi:hypothetical protein